MIIADECKPTKRTLWPRAILMPVMVSLVFSFGAMLSAGLIEEPQDRAFAKAVWEGDVSELAALLRDGANVNGRILGTLTPLMVAAQSGRPELVEFLLAHGADVNGRNRVTTPLIVAASRGKAEVVSVLLAHGASPNTLGFTAMTALAEACAGGYTEVARELLAGGANPITKASVLRKEPIVIAASRGDAEVLMLLLNAGVDLAGNESVGVAALINAAWHGRDEIVRLLLSRGVNVNAVDLFGRTALDAAKGGGHHSLWLELQQAGAIPAPALPPLIAASRLGDEQIVRILLESGADVDVRGRDGTTPLILAVTISNNLKVVCALLGSGADVNATEANDGYTPLMFAAKANQMEHVLALLDFAADPAKQNVRGKTATEIARERGHTDVWRVLLLAESIVLGEKSTGWKQRGACEKR